MEQKMKELKTPFDGAALFKMIDSVIRKERLYANRDFQRSDVVKRFGVGRHRLNLMLTNYADGKSFPQYINAIRLEESLVLLNRRPVMPVKKIAEQLGLSCANFRFLFKMAYGENPATYRRKLG